MKRKIAVIQMDRTNTFHMAQTGVFDDDAGTFIVDTSKRFTFVKDAIDAALVIGERDNLPVFDRYHDGTIIVRKLAKAANPTKGDRS